MGRSVRRVINGVAVLAIVAGPIVIAAWQRQRPAGMRHRAVVPLDSPGPAAGVAAPSPAVDRATRYAARRNPLVDQFLPEGAGGTRFVERLGGDAGRAHAATATILLAATEGALASGEAVEIHERAHLLHWLAFQAVTPLLRRMAPPSAEQYAAKSPGEHFAEMAASAWEFVTPLFEVCFVDPPADRLRDMERVVPGTAGFVAWYLRQPALAELRDRAPLLAVADELAAPLRAEWEPVWRALAERRQADGTFVPWPAPTIRGRLEADYHDARGSDSWLLRLYAMALRPSLAVVKLLR